MLIDWFTVIAQLINFVILLVALKYLLYDRIVQAMERRRDSIAAEQEEAAERHREAEEKAEAARRERRDLESRRQGILDEARKEAKEQREELLSEAREEVADQEERWRQSARDRQEQLLVDLARVTAEHAVETSRRLVRDLADRRLEAEMVRGFLEQLDSLGEDDRAELAAGLGDPDEAVVVRTGFEPSQEDRAEVASALAEVAGVESLPGIGWERDDHLIAGIVVTAGAATISWTVDAYLGDLDSEFQEVLRAELGRPNTGGPEETDAEDAATDEAGGGSENGT